MHLIQGVPTTKPPPLGQAGDAAPAQRPPATPQTQGGGDGLPAIPEPHGSNLRRSIAPNPTPLTGESLDFFGGVAVTFGERRCAVSLSPSEMTDFLAFAQAATLRMGIGGNFGAPNLGDALRDQARSQAGTIAGATFARQVPCPSSEATAIIRALLQGMRGSTSGGGPVFVQSCTRSSSFTQEQCECIARVGMGSIPGIHGMSYRREMMFQITQNNPMVGMVLMAQCRVVRY